MAGKVLAGLQFCFLVSGVPVDQATKEPQLPANVLGANVNGTVKSISSRLTSATSLSATTLKLLQASSHHTTVKQACAACSIAKKNYQCDADKFCFAGRCDDGSGEMCWGCGAMFSPLLNCTDAKLKAAAKPKGIIKGEMCMDVVIVDEGCIKDTDPEAMVCANDGTPEEGYCSYGIGPKTCAYCKTPPKNRHVQFSGNSSLTPTQASPVAQLSANKTASL